MKSLCLQFFKESLENLMNLKDFKISEISKQLKDLYRTKKWFNYVGTSLYQETKIIDKNSETFSENLENITFAIFPTYIGIFQVPQVMICLKTIKTGLNLRLNIF